VLVALLVPPIAPSFIFLETPRLKKQASNSVLQRANHVFDANLTHPIALAQNVPRMSTLFQRLPALLKAPAAKPFLTDETFFSFLLRFFFVFYTSPIVVFWMHTISYVALMAVYSFVTLTPFTVCVTTFSFITAGV
jgi:hypothetical protein